MNLSKLPPSKPNRFHIKLCKFRTKFYALNYGRPNEYGVGYEWLGIRIEIGKHNL